MKTFLSLISIVCTTFSFGTDISKYKYIHQLDSIYEIEYKILRHHYGEFHELQLKINALAQDTLERHNKVMSDEKAVNHALTKIKANYPTSIKQLAKRTNLLESEIEGIKENSLIESKEFDSWFETNNQHYNKLHRELAVDKKNLDALQKNVNYEKSRLENSLEAFENAKKRLEACNSSGEDCSEEKQNVDKCNTEYLAIVEKLKPLADEFNKNAPLFNAKYQKSIDLAKQVNEESSRRKSQLEVMLTQNTERMQIKIDEYERANNKLDNYHKRELRKSLLKDISNQNKASKNKIDEYNLEISVLYGGPKIKKTLYEASIFFDAFKKEDFVYNTPVEVKDFWSAYTSSNNLPQLTVETYEVTKDLMAILLKRTEIMEAMDNGDIFFVCYMEGRMNEEQRYFLDQVLSSNDIESCHELSLANANLTKLKLYNRSIKDISLISYFHNLKSLDISNNEITDFAPITKLKKVTYLKLRNNSIDSNVIKEFCSRLGMDKKSCVYK